MSDDSLSTTHTVKANDSTLDLATVKSDLSDCGYYLGDASVRQNVVWKRIGRSTLLVTKESAQAHEKASINANVKGKQTDAEGGSQAACVEPGVIPDLEPAMLYAVVTIGPDDCFLTPCGNWKGPTATMQRFEDVKLSFRGDAPTDNVFGKDFQAMTNNAKSIMQQIAVPNTINKGFVVVGKSVTESLRFRHVIFEVCL